MEKIEVYMGEDVAACSFRSVDDDCAWAFVGVYGPNLDNVRSSHWKELVGLISWWVLPLCIGGDFNVTRFSSERLTEPVSVLWC